MSLPVPCSACVCSGQEGTRQKTRLIESACMKHVAQEEWARQKCVLNGQKARQGMKAGRVLSPRALLSQHPGLPATHAQPLQNVKKCQNIEGCRIEEEEAAAVSVCRKMRRCFGSCRAWDHSSVSVLEKASANR